MKQKEKFNWLYGLILSLTMLFGSNISSFASDFWLTKRHDIKMDQPYMEFDVMFYDANGYDSYFVNGVKIYVDDVEICNADYELAWNNDDGGAFGERKYDDYWRHTYEKGNYVVKFFNPYGSDNRMFVRVRIFAKNLNVNTGACTVKIGGYWVNDQGSKKWKERELTFSSIADVIDANSNYNLPGTFSRPSYNKIQYNYDGLKSYSGWAHRIQFKDSENKTLVNSTLAVGATSTSNNVSWNIDQEKQYGTHSVKPSISLLRTFDGVNLCFTKNYYDKSINSYIYPTIINTTTNMWSKRASVKWNFDTNLFNNGTWAVYRYPKGQDGAKTKVASNIDKGTNSYLNIDIPQYETDYVLLLTFVPNGDNSYHEVLSIRDTIRIERKYNFRTQKVTGYANYITYQWECDALEGNETYVFNVFRKSGVDGEWIKLGDVTVADKSKTSFSYKDNANTGELKSCVKYYYKTTITMLDNKKFDSYDGISEYPYASLKGQSEVSTFSASKGNYAGMVKLNWDAIQIGSDPTHYEVYRRKVGSNVDWASIYQTSGTNTSYFYEDNSALPGEYYEYKVQSTSACGDINEKTTTSLDSEGFCRSTGIVSGRISYGTGTAVNNAKVMLVKNSSSVNQFYSMAVKGQGGGIKLAMNREDFINAFQNKSFSVQMFVKPNLQQSDGATNPVFLDLANSLTLSLKKTQTSMYEVLVNNTSTGLNIPADEFTSITVSKDNTGVRLYLVNQNSDVNKESEYTIETVLGSEKNFTFNAKEATEDNSNIGISFGGSYIGNIVNSFSGNVDEIRIFSGMAMEQKGVETTWNHTLAGNEQYLYAYWPLDEGISMQKYAYDYSKTDGTPNCRHAEICVGTSSDSTVPSDNQLSLFAYTDSLGNYTIRGVPFSGEGTTYTIRPILGVHEFSPQYEARFIGASSLIYSGVNFTDVSSFPVSGILRYKDTNFPVSGANIYVDDQICSENGEVITTNDEGKFTVSVPIGDHSITIKKDGHVFINNGRCPADPNHVGTTKTFDRAISENTPLCFWDSTLVNFTGRVVGGKIQGEKPLGFNLSKNNIGSVRIVLEPTEEAYFINMKDSVFNETNQYMQNMNNTIPVESATGNINSVAWRGMGDDAKRIFIITSPETGEFSALVPPLNYHIAEWAIINNTKDEDPKLEAFNENINLTQPMVYYTDSIAIDEKTEKYDRYNYHYALKHIHHNAPIFKVKQSDNDYGAWGIKSYDYDDNFGKEIIEVYSVSADSKSVEYQTEIDGKRYPLFKTCDYYGFDIKAYEEYINKDTIDIETGKYFVDIVPLAGDSVIISNGLSSSQSVMIDNGNIANMIDDTAVLDSLGCLHINWQAGLPNITSPYTRNVSMIFKVDGLAYTWEGFDGIILGCLPTNSNFVTAGPDKVLMVLRDPPGSASSATWETGTTITEERSVGGTWSGEEKFSSTIKAGSNIKTVMGLGVATINDADFTFDVNTGVTIKTEGEDASTSSYITEVTRAISTSSEPEFDGANGDLFIGSSTNLIFGKANEISFTRDKLGETPVLKRHEVFTTNSELTTAFSYSASYIEDVLIPNLEKMRDNKLQKVTSGVLEQYKQGELKNETDLPIYLTTLDPVKDKGKYGKDNHDDVFGADKTSSASSEGPSYYAFIPDKLLKSNEDVTIYDTIMWMNTQIRLWKQQLELNEREKIEAYENRASRLKENLSFDAGASITHTEKNDTTTGRVVTGSVAASVLLGRNWGTTFNKVGVLFDLETNNGGGTNITTNNDTTHVTTFSYTLADNDAGNALSVDVLKSDCGFSPIFRTRGGQTSGPHEPEVKTKYYDKGKIIMEGTMQIEKPALTVDGKKSSILINVPSGSAANYTLELANESETGDDVYYNLLVIDESNANGAQLSIDGQTLTEGRRIKIPYGTTMYKSLQLRQTNQAILGYDKIGIVLASTTQYDPTSTWKQIADTVWVSAQFIPKASAVSLVLDKTLLNTVNSKDHVTLNISFKDYDYNHYKQKGFKVQYRTSGDTQWNDVRTYVINEKDKQNGQYVIDPNKAIQSFDYDMSYIPDGEFIFRVLSVSYYDDADESSNEIKVIKDMHKPLALGNPKPTNGILTFGDDISITFNEDIASSKLGSANFQVSGILNDEEVLHDVALCATNLAEPAAQTDVDIRLDEGFSIDMWINYSSSGTILTHGNGSKKFNVSIDDNQHLVVDIAGNSYVSTTTIEKDKWIYLALGYTRPGILNAKYAHGDLTFNLFNNRNVVDYDGNGRLSVLKGINANIQELTLWDIDRGVDILQSEMHSSKTPSTKHLIGYWKFDEAMGKSATDKARAHNMSVSESASWYMNVENKAIHLDGTNKSMLFIGNCPVPETNDYAVELWFRAALSQAESARVFSVGNDSLALVCSPDGTMEFRTMGTSIKLGSKKYQDNAWHHFALNVLRNGTTTVYIDGENVGQTSSSNVSSLNGTYFVLGCQRTLDYDGLTQSVSYDKFFNGDIDDVRLWNATLNADILRSNYKKRLNGDEKGLIAYYPFEHKTVDEYGQIVTETWSNDMAKGESINGDVISFVEGPAQKPSRTSTTVSYSYVASERTIVFNLPSLSSNPEKLEGAIVNFNVVGVEDMNGNPCQNITWNVLINTNQLYWVNNSIHAIKQNGKEATVTATVHNRSVVSEQWSISGLPSWIKANVTSGSLAAQGKETITFTIGSEVQIGKHQATIYLRGNSNIEIPLNFDVEVTGETPMWSVNPSEFNGSLTIFGQLKQLGVVSENTSDIVAAFVNGECRGVAKPIYYPRYDTYYTLMTIYSNDEDDEDITFKAWNASEGKIYPVVSCYENRTSTTPISLSFVSNDTYGSFAEPFVWNADNKIEENLDLTKGWNWISLYVDNGTQNDVNTMLASIKDSGKTVKYNTSFATVTDGVWGSMLERLEVGKMYMLNMNNADRLTMQGAEVDATAPNYSISLNKGWNWIGVSTSYNMNLNNAFAGAAADGDQIKGQTGFAMFDGYEWVGTLKAIIPGEGYMYQNNGNMKKSFNYPCKTSIASYAKATKHVSPKESSFDFDENIYHKYQTNMTMVATILNGTEAVADVEVAVVSNGEIRDIQTSDSQGRIFFTIPGNNDDVLYFHITDGNFINIADMSIDFASNATYGTLKSPCIIQIGDATSINSSIRDTSKTSAYSVSGNKINRDTYNGIIISKGTKTYKHR